MYKINKHSQKLSVFVIAIALIIIYITPLGVSAQKGDPLCPPFNRTQEHDLTRSQSKECRIIYRELNASQIDAAQVSALSTAGPDEYGYTYDDSISYSWISAANNTGVTGDDSFSGSSWAIGFDFPFYGFDYSHLYFSTNGLITFDEYYLYWGGETIPNIDAPNNYIAPFWEDLVVGSPYNSGGIYYETGGVSPDRYLVLEWRT